MRGTGLMASMMAMGLKRGQGVADIEGSIDKVSGMVLECTGFIQVTCMLGNGLVDRAMGAGFILVRMVVGMWENSNGELNMVLDTTISGNSDAACIMLLLIYIYIYTVDLFCVSFIYGSIQL